MLHNTVLVYVLQQSESAICIHVSPYPLPLEPPSRSSQSTELISLYSAIKGNEIELFVVRWVDLESVMQSEVREREKQIPYANAYIWNLKKKKWY